MTVPARLGIVTLGVADLARAIAFYEALGWERCSSSNEGISWFRTADTHVGLFPLDELAAGGRRDLLKPAMLTDWGGTSGYFADPDGYPWEIAHDPFLTIGEDGRVHIP